MIKITTMEAIQWAERLLFAICLVRIARDFLRFNTRLPTLLAMEVAFMALLVFCVFYPPFIAAAAMILVLGWNLSKLSLWCKKKHEEEIQHLGSTQKTREIG